MKFSRFRQYNDRIRATTGVHDKQKLLTQMLMEAGDDLWPILGMMLVGRLSRPQENLTTGIKETFIAKDLGLEDARSLEEIAPVAMERAEVGDGRNPSIDHVWEIFRTYLQSGNRKNADKSAIINLVLFDLAKSKEDIPLLLQILCGKVSNGVQELSLLYAVYDLDTPEDKASLSLAYALRPDLWWWLEHRPNPWTSIRAEPGVPLEPQLCARVQAIAEVLEEHGGRTLVQPKLDGERAHVHVWTEGSETLIRIFSRSQKDMTEEYAEIVAAVRQMPVRKSAIFDGELVAVLGDEILPFQVLQKRLGRKKDRDVVKVAMVVYDVLLLDDEPVESMRYMDRLALIGDYLPEGSALRSIAEQTVVLDDADSLEAALMEAYEAGEEGLVCKNPHSKALPGSRSKDWVKLKPDYMDNPDFGDTLDLVVIGYTKGRGKRHGKIGALWVGVRDADRSQIWPVCKVGSGLTNDELARWSAILEPARKMPPIIAPVMNRMPALDAWVEPLHVIEVRAAGLTKLDAWAGFSLRFPRYIRHRKDKTVKQATSTAEIEIP